MNNFQKIIVLVMVVTGTLNTVSAGLQLAVPARGKDRTLRYFEHYYVQTLFMMFGECMCMVVYLILKYIVNKEDPEKFDGEALPMNPLVLWPAAAFDLVGTGIGYMGLAFMHDTGMFQMLRVSPIIFCGLLSIPFLGQRLKWFNWTGIVVVCSGIVVKGIPYVAKSLDKTEPACPPPLRLYNGTYEPEPEDSDSLSVDTNYIIGVLMVIVGEFFHGCQFVYEEKFVTKYNLPPMKVVGIEGICGVLTLGMLLWPMYFIKMPTSLPGAALGPEGRLEDAIDGFVQIFDGDNGGWLLCWTIGNMCSIAVFNFAGITVTKELNATTRAVLDQIRVILIWAIYLIPLGLKLCLMQGHFHWTAPIGLVILISGVFIYNDVIIMPLIRKYILKSSSAE